MDPARGGRRPAGAELLVMELKIKREKTKNSSQKVKIFWSKVRDLFERSNFEF